MGSLGLFNHIGTVHKAMIQANNMNPLESLPKIKNKQLDIINEMNHDLNSNLDQKALNRRLSNYRSQFLSTTRELEDAIAALDIDITIPLETLR